MFEATAWIDWVAIADEPFTPETTILTSGVVGMESISSSDFAAGGKADTRVSETICGAVDAS